MDILVTKKSKDYELLDSGDGQKLERYGEYVLSRPDTQAIWGKKLGSSEWSKADAVFSHGEKTLKWNIKNKINESWSITLNDIVFSLSLLPSKHLGVFPEQSSQWTWIAEKIASSAIRRGGGKVTVLNLFGYTGGASLVCAKAGAEVVHVDASKFAVDLAHKNLKLSGLSQKPVRFIINDVRKFVEREIKRGNKYDIILMDPPVYGKGVKKEVWKIETDLTPFLLRVKKIVSDNPLAIVLNGYASVYSAGSYRNLLESITNDMGGDLSCGELTIEESSGRMLPCGIYSRWSK
ncbi:MAG: SAM dependent methyltransferase [Parcubacteria bacterium C7867-006]|nr:MAG: SAM dependent methyltransferase [Parcubacteria bacterium C7867-006]